MKMASLPYKCPTCETEQSHYTWDTEVKKKKHNCITPGCKTKLGFNDIIEKVVVKGPIAPGIRTPTKNRV